MGLLGIVFGHGYGGDFKLAIVPQDHGMVANALTQAFKSAPGVKVRVPATQQDAMRLLGWLAIGVVYGLVLHARHRDELSTPL